MPDASLFGAFLLAPGLGNAFFAGVFTGFLPCGLVYAFLALASATQNMFAGWLTMLAFGLGTMPIMVLTGLGGGLLTFRAPPGVSDCRLVRGAGRRAFGGAGRGIPRIGRGRAIARFYGFDYFRPIQR